MIKLPRREPVSLAAQQRPGQQSARTPLTLDRGSLLARLLRATWQGDRFIVVKAPPGAGKTQLLAELTAQLLLRTDLSINIATGTRQAGFSVAERVASCLLRIGDADPSTNWATMPTVNLAISKMNDGPQVRELDLRIRRSTASTVTPSTVTVRTVASLKIKQDVPHDVLILDEAYQLTYSDAMVAASRFDQVVMIGDPGQIGPVVPVPTDTWSGMPGDPSQPVPIGVLATHPDTTVLSMDSTYRLGPVSTRLVAPLYDFTFTSRRPQRGADGLSELCSHDLGKVDSVADPKAMRRAADLVESMIGQDWSADTEAGPVTRPLTARDLCVVVAHNAQVTALSTMLADAAPADGDEHITVGTADQLQGGQWPVVFALDSIVGHPTAKSFQMSLGRLCVMVSRHTGNLIWVHDQGWQSKIDELEKDTREKKLGRAIRTALTRNGQTI